MNELKGLNNYMISMVLATQEQIEKQTGEVLTIKEVKDLVINMSKEERELHVIELRNQGYFN